MSFDTHAQKHIHAHNNGYFSAFFATSVFRMAKTSMRDKIFGSVIK